jgi:alpha-beta hydrolase superfamily lysophospholipase
MRALAVVLLALTLGACAPMLRQQALSPAAGFQGPRLEADALISFDGARLGLTTWRPDAEPWAVIVALHGMNDYANAFHLAAPEWARAGVATYAYDQRGFGRSPGRGVWAGPELMAEDLRTATALVRARHPNAILAVVGESMGGSVAVTAAPARPQP